ncbi:MAG: HAMP domain-containing sensor histidine kinase [Candidatus Vecturithrix sp.]|jgi:signal transduction histidine kinase|nr:HAMP domain-containing sensor histidine kinase [Candidatus Vecturithrix sp.]
MNVQNTLSKKYQDIPASRGNFFRELEIEFLLHELKDPLSIIETGMRSLLEKSEKYGPLSPRQEKTLKRTLRNTKKVREMLNGLLEIGRSEAGRFACCRFQPAQSLYAVLMDVLEITDEVNVDPETVQHEMRHVFSLHGISLHIAPQVFDIEIEQDETKFRQIIGNLIKNALYHKRTGIEILMEQEQRSVVIDVIDDGPGIAPEHHHLIFQRYTQIRESEAVTRQGHGLGLAGSLVLAQSLGGNIELHSEQGKGATFRLILPVVLHAR